MKDQGKRIPVRGRKNHRSALGYRGDKLIAIELDHDDYPDSAQSWRDRGDIVEIVSEREALRRWDSEVRDAPVPPDQEEQNAG